MFRFAVLFAAALLMNGPAQADVTLLVEKLKYFKACPNCDLSGADLSGAKLAGANLFKANLKGANLTGANLADANLRDANIKNAKFCNTKTPWGLDNSGCKK